ncbi:MAG: nickel pincer cofactor biosynthesis protein LarB [Alkalinema sp. RL_2_19]|nr:nickel pincer cofactor biosynthesis protein LarB [Alkalinema sp. RL_2_19]
MSHPKSLQNLLQAVAQGQLSPEAALQDLKHLSFETIDDFARIDHHRALRTGFPEVIWGQDKPPEQIAQIMTAMHDRGQMAMATRVDAGKAAWIQQMLPQSRYYDRARICVMGQSQNQPPRIGTIGILTAGTADLPVAEEAAVTAELCGFTIQRLWDVGVAGIHRLLANRHVIDQADVLIVVAGMEGALPSVVGGLADCPIIAVPTSIGYGASFNGIAPLLGMLNSCAAGLGVVNIDNGFGAAILAGQILRTASKLNRQSIKPPVN